jgi:hypothetical protein
MLLYIIILIFVGIALVRWLIKNIELIRKGGLSSLFGSLSLLLEIALVTGLIMIAGDLPNLITVARY